MEDSLERGTAASRWNSGSDDGSTLAAPGRPGRGDPSGRAGAHYTRHIEILIVCTGNTCRSPMAAALLGRTLADRGVVARIGSAGLVSEGQPATADAQAVMSARGLDLSAHRSRLLDVERVSSADLVLAMARQHLREAVVRRPDRYSRTFTLKELVRRGGEVGPRDPDEPLAAWLARAHSGRTPASQLGVSPLDDVEDPVGRGPDVDRETAGELDSLTTLLVDLLWRQVPSTARS